MWKQLKAILFPTKADQLIINSYGQEVCGVPFEKIQEVMEWLGMSLVAAGYQATAHIIWDSTEAELTPQKVFRGCLKYHEPTFLYRCGDRTILHPPVGHFWRLMSEYSNLRIYQLESKRA